MENDTYMATENYPGTAYASFPFSSEQWLHCQREMDTLKFRGTVEPLIAWCGMAIHDILV